MYEDMTEYTNTLSMITRNKKKLDAWLNRQPESLDNSDDKMARKLIIKLLHIEKIFRFRLDHVHRIDRILYDMQWRYPENIDYQSDPFYDKLVEAREVAFEDIPKSFQSMKLGYTVIDRYLKLGVSPLITKLSI